MTCEQEASGNKLNPGDTNSTSAELYQRIECASGWTGQNCTEEINECDSNPCMNGGLCQESTIPGQFVCLCPPSYTGKFCHQQYNSCNLLNGPCKNNSTCLTMEDGSHSCICREGFGGEHCEISINDRLFLPCQNYGDFEEEIKFRHLSNCEAGSHETFGELDTMQYKVVLCLHGENCLSNTWKYNCFWKGINCEVNTECLLKPCLHGGACVEGISHYPCNCTRGCSGTLCETDANECLSNPRLCGRCIGLINQYLWSCDSAWTSTRCEIKINNCTWVPRENGTLCVRAVQALVFTCPHVHTADTDTFCGKATESFDESEVCGLLCLRGGISTDGPGHRSHCRWLSGLFCEMNTNEPPSSSCLHDKKYEDYINRYVCKCHQGWSRYHCEKELEKCVHKICVDHGPGSSCLCTPESVTCSIWPLCGDMICRVIPAPPISQETEVHVPSTSHTSTCLASSIIITKSSTQMDIYPVPEGPKPTAMFKHHAPAATPLAAQSIGLGLETYLLEELISAREPSGRLSVRPPTDASSRLLSFGLHDPTQNDWGEIAPCIPAPTAAAMPSFSCSNRETRAPFIISSLMTDLIFPAPSSLVESYEASSTTVSSVFSGIPGTDMELNVGGPLLSRGSLLTTAFTSAPAGISRRAQEDAEEYSAVSLVSRGEHREWLSSSVSPVFPTKIIASKQVVVLNSSTVPRRDSLGTIPSEYQVITEAWSSQRPTNIKSQVADSLSEFSQTCATCSMTEPESSHEFSDQVLHSKQSHFCETFWMNSAILASWCALMGTQTTTSGHSFSSVTEITPSVAFTELSSLFPTAKSTERTILASSLEEYTTLSSNLDVNLCLDENRLAIVPSRTISPDLMHSALISKLTADDVSVSENTVRLLKSGEYAVTVGPTEVLNQERLLEIEGSKKSPKLFKPDTSHSSLYFKLNLQDHSDITLSSYAWKKHFLAHMLRTSIVAFYTGIGPQHFPMQTSFLKSTIRPDWSYHKDFLTSLSAGKEEDRTFSAWPTQELHSGLHHQGSPTASQSLLVHGSLALPTLESIPKPQQTMTSEFSCVCYHGDSYLEFQDVFVNPKNNISLEFKTFNSYGLLMYINQNSDPVDGFFIKLFIENGTLQFQFFCAGEAKLKHINSTVRVDDGEQHTLRVRQKLDPCTAELTIAGVVRKTSTSVSHVSRGPLTRPVSVFIGGLPDLRGTNQISGEVKNFTGCIEVIEVNNQRSFIPSKAVKQNHIDSCSVTERTGSTWTSLSTSPTIPSVCQENECRNGGTCHPVYLSRDVVSFQCDCPLHFTGRFCEKDAGLFFPYFNGNSYIELPFLTTLQESKTTLEQEHGRTITIYLTLKTNILNGTILYSKNDFGKQFLHLFLVEGKPMVKYRCGGSQNVLALSANYSMNTNALFPITVRYTMPGGTAGVPCMIEMAANGKAPIQKKDTEMFNTSQAYFESIFLGDVPEDVKIHEDVGPIHGLQGCIQQLQINNKEFLIVDEALRGKNIENCHVPQCAHSLCHNNGTCISDAGSWFCECPWPYSGELCQFVSCEHNPCAKGATCVPRSGANIICLCPFGRSGLRCTDAINITQPWFSGMDVFGYTSFLAYSWIPDISFSYEFHLKFQLANNHSALQDNLIFYTGQKGHGQNGDDFLVVGLFNGSVVYSYNLGSGIATVSSEPLDRSLGVHIVHVGRRFQMGWMKVDDHENKTVISPGRLTGLNVFSHFYVGGYSEYTPALLPDGAHFRNGFQGCIFSIQVRTEKDSCFRGLGNPDAGRSVGQCDATACASVTCGNGGTCVERGSTVYCSCPVGWKGALCTETVSPCDPEHDPPHRCSNGATCISLPHGYTCYCPLGATGVYCEQALSISDPSFRSHDLSWMSFASFHIQTKTHIQLQFQPLAADGILFYAAQNLKAQSGDFLCISLVNGSVQLRYNLGDITIILETLQQITTNGSTWHTVKAGRVGAIGYLDLDGRKVTTGRASAKMTSLDIHTDFYIGGVPSLSLVNPMAIANEPGGFEGCVREVVINHQELQLTELGAKAGSNVGDCDGTACGYNTCRNGGECTVNDMSFSCRCLPGWAGSTCNQSTQCLNHLCLHRSLCVPGQSLSYTCLCALGWVGRYCENKTSFSIAKFLGNSYIKYIDPNYKKRNLQFTVISFNFSTAETDGLILWMGKAQNEEDDFLAFGLYNKTLKIAVNLGERISVSMSYNKAAFCCNKWHHVVIMQNQTLIKAYLDSILILSEDIDPCKKFVALNYDGICYFGGFEYGRKVNIITQGIFERDFIGKIKDVVLFQDPEKIRLINSEGYNIYNGDEQN